MTFRIMVVDDEPIVTDWIGHLLGATFGDTVDLYRHNDATAALRQLLTGLFDIAILDISMPEITGIEILKEMERRKIDTQVVFLTAYGEFEYAKQAITPQVVAYILKGEPDDRLVQAIRAAMKRIGDKIETENLVRIANSRLHASPTGIRREYVVQALQGRSGLPETEPGIALLVSPQKETRILVCALNGDGERPRGPGLLLEIAGHIEDSLGRFFVFEGAMVQNDCFAWLIQPRNGEDPGTTALLTVIESAQMLYSRHTGQDLMFLYTGVPVPFTEIGKAYQRLVPLLGFGYGKGHIVLTEEDLPEAAAAMSTGEDRTTVTPRSAAMLQSLIERGERKESLTLLDGMLSPFGKMRPDSDPVLLETFCTVSGLLLAVLNRTGTYGAVSRRQSLVWLGDPHAFSSGEEAAASLRDLADTMLSLLGRKRDGRSQACIDKVREYIARNLDKDLSLLLLAEKVYLNPSYLSILFKNKVGCTLSDYIKAERLKKATQLLSETTDKVGEIAKCVGYPNATYFGKFIRQETGLTPLEYRDRHGVREGRP